MLISFFEQWKGGSSLSFHTGTQTSAENIEIWWKEAEYDSWIRTEEVMFMKFDAVVCGLVVEQHAPAHSSITQWRLAWHTCIMTCCYITAPSIQLWLAQSPNTPPASRPILTQLMLMQDYWDCRAALRVKLTGKKCLSAHLFLLDLLGRALAP